MIKPIISAVKVNALKKNELASQNVMQITVMNQLLFLQTITSFRLTLFVSLFSVHIIVADLS